MMEAGYTQFPNIVFDKIMPELSHSGWKLFCFIWRKTAGWNKTSDHISYSQITDGTGIKGRATIAKAIEEVSKFIKVESNTGRGNSCEFDITEVINSSEIVIKSSENEPFNLKNSSEIVIKSSVFDVKSSEIEHTKVVVPVVAGGQNEKPKPDEFTPDEVTEIYKIAYDRWTRTFKDMGAKRYIFDDYFEDKDCQPDWILKAVNETIVAEPKQPFKYFKAIVDSWITNGGPVEREVRSPPPSTNGHKSPDAQAPQPGKFVPVANFTLG